MDIRQLYRSQNRSALIPPTEQKFLRLGTLFKQCPSRGRSEHDRLIWILAMLVSTFLFFVSGIAFAVDGPRIPVVPNNDGPRVPVVPNNDEMRRAVGEDVRELTTYTRSGVKRSSDFLRPLAPKRLNIWRRAAELGIADGQYLYGFCIECGLGIQSNAIDAISWYRKAAEQGHALAQYDLAVSYDTGTGVTKDPTQAVAWMRKAAEQGHANAQGYMSLFYDTGTGVTKDPTQASAWLLKAAEQGNAQAQCLLGPRYMEGYGVTEDPTQAVAWYRKSAEQGNADAQNNLGVCYENGTGIAADTTQAVAWYRKAAEQGHAGAQVNLGLCVQNGRGVGVTKDPAQAVTWYRKAAEQGDARAHYLLGRCYEFGEGFVQDDLQACVHYLIASALGDKNASSRLDRLRGERLSAAGYTAAQRQANTWLEKFRAGSKKGDGPQMNEPVTREADSLRCTGSGFVISSDGYFFTCAHVVEAGKVIKVRFADKTYPATLVRTDSRNDVALLKLQGADFRPLAISQALPEMGDKVFTVGFPNPELQGNSAKFTDGSISALSGIMDDVRTMQITAPIQGGNSGGALVDEAGSVVGLVVAQLNAIKVFEYTGTIPQNVNFAVKIAYAMPLIQNVPGLARRLPQPRMFKPKTRPIEDVQAATGLVLVYE